LLVASTACCQQQFVTSSPREVPVSAVVDVLVVGGNEGGIAAAWKAAQGGASALVLSENYFLSDDVSAKARYWLEADEVPRGEFSRALFGSRIDEDFRFPTPWKYKMRIEDLLQEVGVQYQYNTRPVAALRDASGDIAGVAVANKGGIQAIIAKVVIDATSTGTVARMMGAAITPWPPGQVTVSRVAYQKNLSGSKRFGDFSEYSHDVSMASGSWSERCNAEVFLREIYNSVKGNRAHAPADALGGTGSRSNGITLERVFVPRCGWCRSRRAAPRRAETPLCHQPSRRDPPIDGRQTNSPRPPGRFGRTRR
jgi:hypothetical protein